MQSFLDYQQDLKNQFSIKISEDYSNKFFKYIFIISFLLFFSMMFLFFLQSKDYSFYNILTFIICGIFSSVLMGYMISLLGISIIQYHLFFKIQSEDFLKLDFTEKKVEISFLPNQVVNTETNSFIIDNKIVEFEVSSDTLFLKENIGQPYIIEYKYEVSLSENKYTNLKEVNNILEKINPTSVVKEVHY